MTADEPTDLIPRLAVTARLGAREGDAFFSANREAWLGYVVNMWRPYFEHAGAPLPVRIYVSVGRPARDTSTGVCFPGEASDDGYPHIFIHPVISDSTRAAGTLVHQLCHAALGNRRHDAAFKRVATTVGLIGRMTRTVEGPFFVTLMVPAIVDRIGPYPHSSLRQLRNLEQPPRSRAASFGLSARSAATGCVSPPHGCGSPPRYARTGSAPTSVTRWTSVDHRLNASRPSQH